MKSKHNITVLLDPIILDEAAAAAYLCRTVQWLKRTRHIDIARARKKSAPIGPTWVVLVKSIFYRPEDLRAWVAENIVVRGTVPYESPQNEGS